MVVLSFASLLLVLRTWRRSQHRRTEHAAAAAIVVLHDPVAAWTDRAARAPRKTVGMRAAVAGQPSLGSSGLAAFLSRSAPCYTFASRWVNRCVVAVESVPPQDEHARAVEGGGEVGSSPCAGVAVGVGPGAGPCAGCVGMSHSDVLSLVLR